MNQVMDNVNCTPNDNYTKEKVKWRVKESLLGISKAISEVNHDDT
jgi:hypothetical protein